MTKLSNNVNWDRVQEKMIEKYPTLTEKDFDFDNNDELIIHLEQKLGKSKEELREIIRKI